MIIQTETLQAEFKTATTGMWVFLASELCFLSALFTAFLIYQLWEPQAFALGRQQMDLWSGTINTAVLLTSSFCVALSNWLYRKQRFTLALSSLLMTVALGSLFLLIKGYEYWDHAHHHLLPGYDFQFPGPEAKGVKMFFILYFIMTAIHALHLLIGLLALVFVSVKVWRKAYPADTATGPELVGLYWHFVDLIWIFLFPLLYLGNVS
jgi:cytochrome c oxidase subunit 3